MNSHPREYKGYFFADYSKYEKLHDAPCITHGRRPSHIRNAMTYKITCPFSITNSHQIHTVGFRGGNKINLTLPLKLDAPLGLDGTSVEITKADEYNFIFNIISKTLANEDEQVAFVEKIAEYLSFLIAIDEVNPHYGTSYVQPRWFDFRADVIPEGEFRDQVKVSDALEITTTRTINLFEKNLPGASHNELLRFYVDGLRAEHMKSKYFHWFLIIEYIENSMAYKALFNSSKLFDENEIALIKEAAEKMGGGTKKGTLLNLLSRTKEFRIPKLVKFLDRLGIVSFPNFNKDVSITEEIMKGIVDGRNSLFHSGSQIPEAVLWLNLFPLATLIVRNVSCNPKCLDQTTF